MHKPDEVDSISYWITPSNLADRLLISERTIRKWLKAGAIKGIKVGGYWRINVDDAANFIETMTLRTTPSEDYLNNIEKSFHPSGDPVEKKIGDLLDIESIHKKLQLGILPATDEIQRTIWAFNVLAESFRSHHRQLEGISINRLPWCLREVISYVDEAAAENIIQILGGKAIKPGEWNIPDRDGGHFSLVYQDGYWFIERNARRLDL